MILIGKRKSLVDVHTHSEFSKDSNVTLKDYVDKAQTIGLKGICFTEHVDQNPEEKYYDFYSHNEFNKSLNILQESLKASKADLLLLKGIEYSEPNLYPEEFRKLTAEDFDMVMAAVHWVNGGFLGSNSIIDNNSKSKIFSLYYKRLLNMVKFGDFDVLAHFDFPRRYLGRETKKDFHEEKYNILQEIIKQDIVIELNTSSIRKAGLELMPARDILLMYKNLGGEKVVLGSDAHLISDLAADIGLAKAISDEMGLISGYFKERKFVEYKY